jgi:DnaJ family protein C protein 28
MHQACRNKLGIFDVNTVMKRWESSVEKQIREAMEAGKFDNLPGKGKPVDLSENPFEDPDLRTAHRLLRNAGFAPAFIEERKDIDRELEQARTALARAWTIYQRAEAGSQDALWERVQQEFRERAEELNKRIRVHNLRVPASTFHRNLIDVERELERVQETS